MRQSVQSTQRTAESLAEAFFRQSEGRWRSERRYYTLKSGKTQEVVSYITVRYLDRGSADLVRLARLHQLPDESAFVCGAESSWESNYLGPKGKQSTGSTVFGVLGTTLYRDRGFATQQPITAQYYFLDPKTMCLRTEYGGSVFEEELKLIGSDYRTRQTIISRAGEEQMIGQYLERRLQ